MSTHLRRSLTLHVLRSLKTTDKPSPQAAWHRVDLVWAAGSTRVEPYRAVVDSYRSQRIELRRDTDNRRCHSR